MSAPGDSWVRQLSLRQRLATFAPGGVPLNTAAMSVRTVVRAVVGIILLPLLLDRIGATATGLFIFATTLTGYFTAVELGLGTSVTKYVAEYRATGADVQLNSVLRGSTLLMSGLGVLIAAGLTVFALLFADQLFSEPSIESEALPTLLVAAATAILYWPSRVGVAALEGLERYDISAAIQICSSLVSLALFFWVTSFSNSVPLLTAIFGGLLILEGAAAAMFAWPHLGLRRGHGRWLGPDLRPALTFGGGLFVIGFADTLLYSLDRTIVAAFVGASAIVAYEAALRPQNGVRSIAGMAGGALISTMSRLFAQRRNERVRELILIASFIGVTLTTPIAILVMVLARPFVEAWLGSEYVQYAVYIQIFTSFWLVHGNTSALTSAITGLGKLRVFVWMTVIGAVISLIISIAFTARWGTVGVIWGTVIPSWVGLPIWMHFALKYVGIPWSAYTRSVLVPTYTPMAIWTVGVIAAKTVLNPEGFAGVLAFGTTTLLLLWLAMFPTARRKWARAASFDDGMTPGLTSA